MKARRGSGAAAGAAAGILLCKKERLPALRLFLNKGISQVPELIDRENAVKDLLAMKADDRMPRRRYALCAAVWGLALVLAGFAAAWQASIGEPPRAGAGLALVSAWFLGVASVRRLHDLGRSGWWLIAVAAVLPLGLAALLAAESIPGGNRWGENPKGLLRIGDHRLLDKLARGARPGSAMHEILSDGKGPAAQGAPAEGEKRNG